VPFRCHFGAISALLRSKSHIYDTFARERLQKRKRKRHFCGVAAKNLTRGGGWRQRNASVCAKCAQRLNFLSTFGDNPRKEYTAEVGLWQMMSLKFIKSAFAEPLRPTEKFRAVTEAVGAVADPPVLRGHPSKADTRMPVPACASECSFTEANARIRLPVNANSPARMLAC